jgi:hypothetical protein
MCVLSILAKAYFVMFCYVLLCFVSLLVFLNLVIELLVMERDFRGEIVQVEGVTGERDDVDDGHDGVELAKTLARSAVSGALFEQGVRRRRQPRPGFRPVSGGPLQNHFGSNALKQTRHDDDAGNQRAQAVDNQAHNLMKEKNL